MGIAHVQTARRKWALITIILGISACGSPLPVHVFSTKDAGATDPTKLGLPANFPVNPPPDKLTISPNPMTIDPTPFGSSKVAQFFLINTLPKNITISPPTIDQATNELQITGGTCSTLVGGVLNEGAWCEIWVTYTPQQASSSFSNQLDLNFDDGAAETLTAPISASSP